VFVITWYLGLHLPVQSVPITTKIVISNTAHREVYSIQQYVIKVYHWLATGQLFSPGIPVSSTIFLHVALYTITLT